jgi:hypothetical protein
MFQGWWSLELLIADYNRQKMISEPGGSSHGMIAGRLAMTQGIDACVIERVTNTFCRYR